MANNLRFRIILLLMAFSAFAGNALAGTILWAAQPEYQDIQRYYGDIFLFKKDGKFGMINADGKIQIPVQYDFITPFYNGYALVGKNSGGVLRLDKIISEKDFSVTSLSIPYYLHKDYPVFSNGLLIVINSKGKYGFITPAGKEIIKCEYNDALPYKEGWAPVKKGKLWKFVHPTDNPAKPRKLLVNFNNNDITMTSPFERGRAVVAYNTDCAVINPQGEKVQKITADDFKKYRADFTALNPTKSFAQDFSSRQSKTYSAYRDGSGLYGISDGKSTVASPQFTGVNQIFDDDLAIVSTSTGLGLVKIIDGQITSSFRNASSASSDRIKADKNGNPEEITFTFSIPAAIGFSNGSVMIDPGNGNFVNMTGKVSANGTKRSVTFRPVLADGAKEVTVKARVTANGVNIPAEQRFSVSRKAPIRIAGPSPARVRANENKAASVHATIYNDSDYEVSVSCSWTKGNITIPAHGSKTVSRAYSNITTSHVKTVSITVDGVTKSASIQFDPYF